jgi:phage baseplate assembly protein W
MREMEVPLDRMRGMRSDMIDHAVDIEDIESDMLETISVYEPRSNVDDIDVSVGYDGDIEINLEISSNYDDEDDQTNEEREQSILENGAQEGG